MTQQRYSKSKKSVAVPKKDRPATDKKKKAKLKTGSPGTKVGLKGRRKADEPQDASRKGSPIHQNGIEYAAQRRRASFLIRLTLDANDEFERIEIEHVLSNKIQSKKQSFANLNGENLVAFMKECVNTGTKTTSIPRLAPVFEKVDNSRLDLLSTQPTLRVSDLQLLDSKNTNVTGLSLAAQKPFIVQPHFQLGESQLYSLTNIELSYEIKIHATEITTGISNLLGTHHSKLIPGMMDYTAPIEIAGLAQGLYRLFTVIRLEKQMKTTGFYDGPVIQVI